MAKAKSKKPSKRAYAREKVSEVVNNVREPFSLLGTLKEEGVANAVALMGLASAMASGATRNFRLESIKPQLRELIGTMGFALKADLENLEARVEELETKLSEKEFEAIRGNDEE
jgi:hypothetical protein